MPKDDVQAHKWINLATSRSTDENQSTCAKARDAIAAGITPEQVVEAQRLARKWAEAFERRPRT